MTALSEKISTLPPAVSIDGSVDVLPIVQTGTTNKINRNTFLGVTGTPADISTAQNLTNKVLDNTNTVTLKDTNFTLQDDGDATKQGKFQLSGITTGNTRTYTLPNASVTLASLTGTETLTNKTLTSPAINGGTIDNSTITVDSISGHTSATNVTVGGVALNNGVVSTANSVTSTAIAAGAVQPQALQSGTGTGWAWSSFTPSLVNFTVGTGGSAATSAFYIQIGKTVFYRLVAVLGSSGQSVGSGVSFTLPVARRSGGESGTGSTLIGVVKLEHTGVSNFTGAVSIAGAGSTATVLFSSVSSTLITLTALSSTTPFVWAAGDSLNIEGFYEAS